MTSLLASAIELGVSDASGQFEGHQQAEASQRLRVGGDERVERGRLLRTSCGRITVRSLRVWVIDAPAGSGARC